MLNWTDIDWSAVGLATLRLGVLLGLIGGSTGGTYYYASEKVEEKAAEVIHGRQQEALGTGVLIADMKRQIMRLEDEQDRMKGQLRALWRKVGRADERRTPSSKEDEKSWINPRGGRYAKSLDCAP